MSRILAVGLGLVILFMMGACNADQGDRGHEPVLESVDCPAEVDITFLEPPECHVLVVPADRSDPEGGSVRLLVAKVLALGKEPSQATGTGGLHNIGDPLAINGNMQTGVTRSGGIGVFAELRGAGPHVSPSLRCPEISALDTRGPAAPTGDPQLTADFVDAVRACGERLRAQGVDPAAFDVTQTAEDIEDLRRAFDVDHWDSIGSEGTASRYLFQYMRMHPTSIAVPGVNIDSPWFPEIDDVTGGVLGTRSALREFFDACKSDPTCDDHFPDLEEEWDLALDHLAAEPIQETYHDPDRGDIEVLIDAGKLLRVARFALGGDGPKHLTELPRMITAAAKGEATTELLKIVASDPIFCAGYRPLCEGQEDFAHGVFLTTLCRDQVPFMDRGALADAIEGDQVYEEVFGRSPWLEACDAWDVEPPEESTAIPFHTDIPTLMLPGQFDSFSRPEWATERASHISKAWSVEIPAVTHNTLGFSPCALAVRAEWRLDPTSAPDPTLCASTPPLEFIEASPDR